MLASVTTYSPTTAAATIMSLNPTPSSPPKRPRLSLQIKTPSTALTYGKSSTALKTGIDPTSPTAFNTLSNAYAAAIENASPLTARPGNFDTTPKTSKPTSLRLETKNFGASGGYIHPSQRTQTPGPFSITYPDTPSSAIDNNSTPTNKFPSSEIKPTTDSFTFTPPQSAGSERSLPRIFTFAANAATNSPNSPRTPRRRMTIGSQFQVAPYTHPRSLHSILRNSPLPPRTTATPATPSRMSLRIANRAAKKVGYNDPLTQTITTNKYVKSHIDLLAEDSPYSATDPEAEKIEQTLEYALEYTGDETRDGGQTPGPFEEMRRRMAESGLETPATRKRRRKDKKRKWEWTITNGDPEGEDEGELRGRTPVTAMKIEETPITAIRRGVSVSDSDMSEAEDNSRYVPDEPSDSHMSGRDNWGSNSAQSESQPSDSDISERPGTSQSL